MAACGGLADPDRLGCSGIAAFAEHRQESAVKIPGGCVCHSFMNSTLPFSCNLFCGAVLLSCLRITEEAVMNKHVTAAPRMTEREVLPHKIKMGDREIAFA